MLQLCVVLGERMAGELEGAHLYNEALIAQLAKEAENGRLLRLLARLSMVVDRPAGDPDAHWSETGLCPSLPHLTQSSSASGNVSSFPHPI